MFTRSKIALQSKNNFPCGSVLQQLLLRLCGPGPDNVADDEDQLLEEGTEVRGW